jgi:hypothetical protein
MMPDGHQMFLFLRRAYGGEPEPPVIVERYPLLCVVMGRRGSLGVRAGSTVAVAVVSMLLGGCVSSNDSAAPADPPAQSVPAQSAPATAKVAGVEVTRSDEEALRANGQGALSSAEVDKSGDQLSDAVLFPDGEKECIRTEIGQRMDANTAARFDKGEISLQALPIPDRQFVADSYLACEADSGMRSLVALGLQAGNPAYTDESAACQAKALYDGLGRQRFAAFATSAIRIDDLTEAEVLGYETRVATCP